VSIDSPKAVAAGIALITEDRKGEGLLLTQSISANIALGNLGAVSRAGVLDRDAEQPGRAADQRHAHPQRQPGAGGGRAVRRQPAEGGDRPLAGARLPVLLFDEPTRGIDVGAKFDIYGLLAELLARARRWWWCPATCAS
jgi:ribose transport system ATP-binding protein